MNLKYLVLLCGLLATNFVHKSEARLHAESIVGGETAEEGQIKYAVSIQVDGKHFCGGGILNGQHIITAAHCFINRKTNAFVNLEYTVVAGVTNAHNKKESHRVKAKVSEIYIPREYDRVMVPNVRRRTTADIAVLKLETDLGLNTFITKLALPRQGQIYPTNSNEQAVVCGYGSNWVTLGTNEETNEVVEACRGNCYDLKFAQVNLISNAACGKIYRNIKDSHLCGHVEQRPHIRPEGLCSGDSGSPLVIGNSVIGVVSTSPFGCREDKEPAIYTRVTSFLPFIENAKNGIKAADMRLAKYQVKTTACGLFCNKRLLVELI